MARFYKPKSDFSIIIGATSDEPDRSFAIIVGSYVEERLRQLIESDLPGANSRLREKLFEGYGPLSTVAARIDMARGRSLITAEMHSHLILINRIRNRFAHNLSIHSFEHDEVRPLCNKLLRFTEMETNDVFDRMDKGMADAVRTGTPRGRFVSAAWLAGAVLLPEVAPHMRVKHRDKD